MGKGGREKKEERREKVGGDVKQERHIEDRMAIQTMVSSREMTQSWIHACIYMYTYKPLPSPPPSTKAWGRGGFFPSFKLSESS